MAEKNKTINESEAPHAEGQVSEASAAEETVTDISESAQTSADESENTADQTAADVTEEETAAPSDEGEKELPAKTFRQSLDDMSAAVAAFISENNIMARFIGLFMMFASFVFIGNYRHDPRIRFFDMNNGEVWKEYSNTVSFGKMGAFIVLAFVGITLLRKYIPKISRINTDGYILLAGVVSFGMCALWRNDSNTYNNIFACGVIAVSLFILAMFLDTDKFTELRKIPKPVYITVMCVLAAGVAVYVAATTIFKHRIFHTAVFDLGIFTQMYHSIVNHFTQVTTCERGYALSHFAVHFSPVYYLLAPVYLIFPSPETLLACQAVLAVSGFIPVYLICRKYNFSDALSFAFSLVYIFSTSVISPCYYEFHENAFLPPFLMWFFWAIEKDKKILMYVMMVLILMVKEDAALYVMCIALYLVFSGKNRKHGVIMFCATAAVFVNVLSLMSKYGEGAMTNRTFGNLMRNYDSGFGEVIRTALSNPMYFINQCFMDEKYEKFAFIFVMVLPLLFMPFVTRKGSRLLLVAPFIVMNLASGYPYASKFDYQYVFGTATCLIYAALINTADFDMKTVRKLVPLMAAASVLMFTANVTNKLYYADVYKGYKENNDRKQAYCDSIPEDASVLATPFLIPHVANRDELYILDEASSVNEDFCDVVVFEDGADEWKQNKRAMLESEGYTVYAEIEGLIVIYKSPSYEFR